MPRRPLSSLLSHLCRRALPATAGEVDDAELLRRFVGQRDEAAFELLVWRHGAPILALCRRLLPQEQDAEDAFQATFLVLVRKAASIGKRDALASWLYKVAYRVACRARAGATSQLQPALLRRDIAETSAQPHDEAAGRELRAILDHEIAALPESYRRAIVLCYLEGKTHDEAAHLLGWPIGTVATRLARGKARLRLLLEQRGWGLSSAGLAAALAEPAPAISAELARATLQAALAHAMGQAAAALSPQAVVLSEGVLRAMWYSKMKLIASVLLAVLVTGAGAGLAMRQAWAGPQPDEPRPAQEAFGAQGALAAQKGGREAGGFQPGASMAELTKLRGEMAALRRDVERAQTEINQLRAALGQAPAQEPGPLYRGRPLRFWLDQANDGDPAYRTDAMVALGSLAQRNRGLVKQVMPVLVTALQQEGWGGPGEAALSALGFVGADAVPALLDMLKNGKPDVQVRAARALGVIGPAAKAAVPALIDAAQQNDRQLRLDALRALHGIGPDAKAAVPMLIGALTDAEHDVFTTALGALSNIGPDAKAALPTLTQWLGRSIQESDQGTAANRDHTSPYSAHTMRLVIDTLRAIDPSIRDLVPGRSGDGSHEVEFWRRVHESLRKKYAPSAK